MSCSNVKFLALPYSFQQQKMTIKKTALTIILSNTSHAFTAFHGIYMLPITCWSCLWDVTRCASLVWNFSYRMINSIKCKQTWTSKFIFKSLVFACSIGLKPLKGMNESRSTFVLIYLRAEANKKKKTYIETLDTWITILNSMVILSVMVTLT